MVVVTKEREVVRWGFEGQKKGGGDDVLSSVHSAIKFREFLCHGMIKCVRGEMMEEDRMCGCESPALLPAS